MQRRSLALATLVFLALAGTTSAKFGMFKTKITIPRVRPAAAPILADTVSVEVERGTSEALVVDVALVRGLLEETIEAQHRCRLVASPDEADARIGVRIEHVTVSAERERRKERRRVKVRDRRESDGQREGQQGSQQQQREDKEAYEEREVPVDYRVVKGAVDGTLLVDGPFGDQALPLSASYSQEFEHDADIPPEAGSVDALRQHLISTIARQAVALMNDSGDPVEAPVAVDGELKNGNKLLKSGGFAEAIAEWDRLQLKGDKEAARRHNIGLAHEALAYRFPSESREHREHLEQAQALYKEAGELDQDEKFFRKALARVGEGIGYARTAENRVALLRDLRRQRAAGEERPVAGAEAEAAAQEASSLMPADSPGPGLDNGDFEAGLDHWSVAGSAGLVNGGHRGQALELRAAPGSAEARRTLAVDLDARSWATLSLAYRVLSGEAHTRVMVSFRDIDGKERVSTQEVNAGEGPGDWSTWSADLLALRPRPASLTEIRILLEGATLQLDDCSLDLR